MSGYVLVRILPGGAERRHSPAPTMTHVQTAAAYVLMDNKAVPRGEAVRFARRLVSLPVGTEVLHTASGYAFRVERAG